MSRLYNNASRAEASRKTRTHAARAAWCVLTHANDVRDVSTAQIALHAGLSRMTLYNLLGDRRACIAAGFEYFATVNDMNDLARALSLQPCTAALTTYCAAFVDFYVRHRKAIAKMRAYAALDLEIGNVLALREKRRIAGLKYLISNLALERAFTLSNAAAQRVARELAGFLGFEFVCHLYDLHKNRLKTAQALAQLITIQLDHRLRVD